VQVFESTSFIKSRNNYVFSALGDDLCNFGVMNLALASLRKITCAPVDQRGQKNFKKSFKTCDTDGVLLIHIAGMVSNTYLC